MAMPRGFRYLISFSRCFTMLKIDELVLSDGVRRRLRSQYEGSCYLHSFEKNKGDP